MKVLGTIYATQKQLAKADQHADRMKSNALLQAEKDLKSLGLTRKIISGEIRYYKTNTIYTPAIARSGVRNWFEVRKDGDYRLQNV